LPLSQSLPHCWDGLSGPQGAEARALPWASEARWQSDDRDVTFKMTRRRDDRSRLFETDAMGVRFETDAASVAVCRCGLSCRPPPPPSSFSAVLPCLLLPGFPSSPSPRSVRFLPSSPVRGNEGTMTGC
jgi:hypothetical protein